MSRNGLLLNCDLGESYGSWSMGMDESVFPHIDQANIACGFHGGDPVTMQKTLQLAKKNNVMVGAHPAYPDLVGFGRRSMNCSETEIIGFMHYQMSALDGMAKNIGLTMEYVKPHGALYNDMMKNDDIRLAILKSVSDFHRPIKLMLQATAASEEHQKQAEALGVELIFEAFADRCYDDDGKLLARNQAGAVHDQEKMLQQVQQLVEHGTVTTASGQTLSIKADSVCVHGDNEAGVKAIQSIRELIQS
ncbi:5-oxoprolinase subunit PxpA [Bermanella marisrubri]|uniref:LamB/YcsF family protein n=1 Tax=Bermanella marisrubri TaxID=207949 RepID=Q1N2K0_9GAMM|nr:5-oxoprolinase subunit PxpA [Bermanella marisrubri]EAT12407.1 LamB/YcsF family protein [Oceanobacter sp. RED65] [Bermanella marisrubri]QIZ85488.1 5-oxoprolinase subunit PxpA [Bermanella marisrubri]